MPSDYPETLDSLATSHVDGETIFPAHVNDLADAINRIERAGVRVFGVTAYGAVGDGVTDDTPAIQAAIDACAAASGGIVFLPAGYYALGSTVKLKDYVTLMGVGQAANSPEYSINVHPSCTEIVHKASVAGTFNLIENDDPVGGNTALDIVGIRFSLGSADGDVSAIKWETVRRSRITRVYMIASNTLTDQPTSRRGIHIVSSEANEIRNVSMLNLGILIELSNSHNVLDCEIGMGGVSIQAGYYHQVRGNQIYSDNVPTGTDYVAWRSGISLNGCDGAIVADNEVAAFRTDGILIISSARCLIQRNTSKGNSWLAAGTWAGLYLDCFDAGNPAEGNVIVGNSFYDAGGTQQFGVSIGQTVGSTNHNLIVGNNLRGNLGGAVNVGAGVGQGNRISQNIGETVPSVASAATVTLPIHGELVTVTGTTTITSLTAGWAGRRVTLTFTGILTFTDGSNLKLAGNFVTTADDTITLISDGTNWIETSRSVV